jgi:hypothetical protein
MGGIIMAETNPNNFYNAATNVAENGALMHVRYNGQSRDITLEALRLTQTSSDQAIKLAIASFLDVSLETFDKMIIERHTNGNMTIRPEAVFG